MTSEAAKREVPIDCCEVVRLSASGWYCAVQHVRPFGLDVRIPRSSGRSRE